MAFDVTPEQGRTDDPERQLAHVAVEPHDLGNACDVGAADVFEYLVEAPATSVIALRLEGLAEGARGCCARPGPWVASPWWRHWSEGPSRGRMRADRIPRISRFRAGSPAGLLAQAGIVPAREFVDLVDLAAVYSLMGTPRPASIGPVVMVDRGGVLVESLGEVAFRLPPLDRAGSGSDDGGERSGPGPRHPSRESGG